jgi:hypothetical protein
MGYYLQAFIGKEKDVTSVFRRFNSVIIHDLEQGISVITLTEKLFYEITNSTPSENIPGFEYLTSSLETNVLKIVGSVAIGYVEASYWGGEGNQSGVIWQNGERIFFSINEQDVINKVLRYFGVSADKGYDEFDTLRFSLLESQRDWDL